jgi:hypothetical protein
MKKSSFAPAVHGRRGVALLARRTWIGLTPNGNLPAVEPESVLSKVAREVGSTLGGAVALLSDLNPMKGESS